MEIKRTILIIDDEKDFTEVMRFFLESANFRVVISNSPEEGIEKARLKPDLILLDLNMPGLSGHEVCKRLKESDATMRIPIIMLTSQDRTIDKVEALNLGVSDYVCKISQFEEILARIRAVLRDANIAASPQVKEDRSKKILELRKIIDEKSIATVFQPIVRLSDKSYIGYEALTRGPKDSFLHSPIDLFTLASAENMLSELEFLCLSFAAKRADFIRDDQILFLNVDLNLINHKYFKELEFLNGSKIASSKICIEIAERTCMTNFAKLSEELAYFKARGVRVAIDDVGEGYSSLKAIAEVKPDFIKVDISLIRNIDSDKVKFSLLQAINELGKKMNSPLIAEGVETEAEFKALNSVGVQFAQGYLFARPAERF